MTKGLDGSDGSSDDMGYANSTDNMKRQIAEIKKKMNLSNYS